MVGWLIGWRVDENGPHLTAGRYAYIYIFACMHAYVHTRIGIYLPR